MRRNDCTQTVSDSRRINATAAKQKYPLAACRKEANSCYLGRRSGTRHAAIRGRLGAHQKRRRGQLPGAAGWYTRGDCAGSRFATCLGRNVRDSSKEIVILNRMTLSLESEQNEEGSRSEWQGRAGVVAGRSEGGQAAGQWEMAMPVFTEVRHGGTAVQRLDSVYLTRLARRPRRGSNQGRGWHGQVPSRYTASTDPTGQAQRRNLWRLLPLVAMPMPAFVYLPC